MTKIDDFAIDKLIELFGEKQIKETLFGDLTKYQDNPVGFIEKELGVENLYQDLIDVSNSVRDNKITLAMSSNGTGKTFIASRLAAWFYLCFPDSQVICAAAPPEENLKQGLFSEISNVYYKYRKTLFKSHAITTLKITDDIGAIDDVDEINLKHFLIGKAIPSAGTPERRKASFSGKHAKYQLYIVDEADGCPDEIFEAIDGCLSGSHVRLLCLFNPRQKSGYVYDMWKEELGHIVNLNAFNHPNVITGEEVIPGAVSRDKTIQRILEWTTPVRDGDEKDEINCFEIPEYLVGAVGISSSGKKYPALEGGWRRIKDSQFATITLGRYPATSQNALFNEVDIDNAITRWKLFKAQYGDTATAGIRPVLGMDVADEGSDDSCVVAKYGNFISQFVPWSGVDLDRSADRLAQMYTDLDAIQAQVEADGIGAAIPPKVSSMFYWRCENIECSGVSKTYLDTTIYQCPICHKDMVRCHFNIKKVYVSSPSNKKCEFGKLGLMRDELAWEVAEWLKKEPSAMLPDDKDLKRQMLVYTYKEDPNSGKIKVSDKKTVKKLLKGKSDDKFAALRQAFYNPSIPRIRII